MFIQVLLYSMNFYLAVIKWVGHHKSKGKETAECGGYNFSCLHIFPTPFWWCFITGNDRSALFTAVPLNIWHRAGTEEVSNKYLMQWHEAEPLPDKEPRLGPHEGLSLEPELEIRKWAGCVRSSILSAFNPLQRCHCSVFAGVALN